MPEVKERLPRILIVDDLPENIHSLMGILQSEYAISAATTGGKAIELARGELAPDLILLDIKMPDPDGYSVLARLKADPATADIPVIFVTGLADVEDEARGIALGVADYISKPVNPGLLRMRVQTQLELLQSRKGHAPFHVNAGSDSQVMPTLLLVDDVPESIHQLMEVLKDEFKIIVARSGVKALEMVDGPQPPDLILLDVVMPDTNGYEVCRRIKQNKRTRDIPVIFVTIQDDPHDEVEGLDLGAVDYITKPVIGAVVRARVRAHLALRKATHDLQRAQAKLFQSEKFAALHNLVAGIAYTLSTPLGNALMANSALRDDVRELGSIIATENLSRATLNTFVARSADGLDIVQRNLGRVADMVETFKQVAADASEERRRKFLLNELVADVLGVMRLTENSSPVSCRCSVVPGLELDSFPSTLARVLISLIQNARVHGYAERGEIIHVNGNHGAGDTINISVSDHGRGISAENLTRIFDPYFSTRFGHGGSGLGLAITQNMVTQILGGNIQVESTVGNGSHFMLNLPVNAPELKRHQ